MQFAKCHYSEGKKCKVVQRYEKRGGTDWKRTMACHVSRGAHGARDTCDTVPGVESEKFKMTQQSDLKSTVSGSIFVA